MIKPLLVIAEIIKQSLLQTIIITLQQFILNIIVQINIFQGFFLEFTGISIDLSTLNIVKICSDGTICSVGGNDVSLGPVLPSELEANLSVIIGVYNIILQKIDFDIDGIRTLDCCHPSHPTRYTLLRLAFTLLF